MARHGWMSSSSPSHSLNRDYDTSRPALQNYFLPRTIDDEECGAVDEEIMLMTDEEKEAFVRMQNELEERHLSEFYNYYDTRTFPSMKEVQNDYTEDEALDYYDGNGFRRMGSSVDIRVENLNSVSGENLGIHHRRVNSINNSPSLSIYQSAQRLRNRKVLHEKMKLDDELTFHPQINPSNVSPRYMNYTTGRSRQSLSSPPPPPTRTTTTTTLPTSSSLLAATVSGNAAGDSNFKPVVNRLRKSSLSGRLSQYLNTPVHLRLSKTPIVSPRKLEKRQQEQEPLEQHGKNLQRNGGNSSRGSGKENKPLGSFLRRLEETNRRREKNLERITMMYESELKFHPELAPGTRKKKRVSSAIGAQKPGEEVNISSRQRTSSTCSVENKRKNTDVGKQTFPINRVDEKEHHTPRINVRSQSMRRSVDDLHIFEQKRQQRLEQLRAEQELEASRAARESFSGIMTLSAGSQRLAKCLFGGNITHDAIQRFLERQAYSRDEALRMEYEAKKREEEMEFTFRPEVHSAPPYVQEIARELAVNKSLAPKAPKPKPAFRFS
ncbi:hypothetical protein LSM04_006237 [Trypanosoma melophagium]|uniref:uncharacterized protein n=1 Tax=Trypanosoma melophagium TaxID=715481 RepID=UPI00351A3E4A|nr:hypothetical protein LSM04_006237 [Trypanosoma melophagium]